MNIKNMRVRKNGYTLSGMDRDSMPDFFIQKSFRNFHQQIGSFVNNG